MAKAINSKDKKPKKNAEHGLNDTSMDQINSSMLRHAYQVAGEIGANAVLVYVDEIKSKDNLESLLQESHCILAARDKNVLEELKMLKCRLAQI